MRPAVEGAQGVACAVHPQTLVDPRGGYHRGRTGGHFPLVGCSGGHESTEPANTTHQSRDLRPGHVAQPCPLLQSRQNALVV